jgi:hypothetical protein
MSKQDNDALKEATVKFVQKVITEVYGQRATRASVAAVARRVIAVLPTNGSQRHGEAV